MNKRIVTTIVGALCVPLYLGFSQEDEAEEDVFELSPFTVDSSEDTGYRATNTLSGTRFNANLRDVSASVSVWTEAFLEDTGLTDIDELIEYSLNTVLDTNDQDGAGGNFNVFTNATAVTQRIRTRGIESTRGIDYFKSIVPDDSYKVGRYDDSRGPNGVLFGVSNAGGLINQTSIVANTQRDSGRIQYSFGTSGRSRTTMRLNRVLIEDKLGIALAGLYQKNDHWRDWVSDNRERIFGAMTWKVNDKITLRANYEDGFHHKTTLQPSPITDRGLPFYDHLLESGIDAVASTPELRFRNRDNFIQGTRITGGQRAIGIGAVNGNPRTAVRHVFIENDGTLYNDVGTYRTVGYDVEASIHPDGTPGLGDRAQRINDENLVPFYLNPGGPDFFRETDLSSHSLFADIQITENWFFNVQAGHQRADIDVPQINGSRPEFRLDPNLTQGLNGYDASFRFDSDLLDEVDFDDYQAPPNPYVGGVYFDGQYRRDKNLSRYDEIRVSTSYNLDMERMGNHRFAVAASEVSEEQLRGNTNLALGGNPNGAGNFTDVNGFIHQGVGFNSGNNQVIVRNYIDLDDRSTWRAGSWRSLPDVVYSDQYTPGSPQAYPVVWAESNPGNINYLIDQVTDSLMAVTHSRFFNNRLALTAGYREDKVTIDRAGHRLDPMIGWLPDFSITPDTPSSQGISPAAPQANFSGTVRSFGAVYHLTPTFSLVANTASNIGVPDFRRTVFPDGSTSPPPSGDGSDFGIDFDLFDGKVSGRVVYYETESIQEVVGGSQLSGRMEALYDIFETAFEDMGDDGAAALNDLLSRRQEIRPEVNGLFRDNVASGYELRLTANFTKNWRFTMNAAHTDRIVSNSFSKGIEFLGLMEAGDGRVIQGVEERGSVEDPDDPENTIDVFGIDRSAYTADGAISKYFEYFDMIPAEDIFTIGGAAFQIFEMADNVNDVRETQEKRWGLRPYRVNFFTAYDFDEGLLKGWSVGGGYRWTAPNIIGEEDGVEFEGKAQTNADMFIRYRTKGNFLGEGRWTFQMNVNNLFDNRDIIPSRLSIDGDPLWQIPGDRGPAYARFDLPTPRQYRFTVTRDF